MFSLVDILLPLGLRKPLTYRIPTYYKGKVARGMMVVVPFKGTLRGGVVWQVHNHPPKCSLKSLLYLSDSVPLWDRAFCDFIEGMSTYYWAEQAEMARIALEGIKGLLTPDYFYLKGKDTEPLTWDSLSEKWGKTEALAWLSQQVKAKKLKAHLPLASPALQGEFVPKGASLQTLDSKNMQKKEAFDKALQNQGVIFLQGGSMAERQLYYLHAIAQRLAQGEQVLYLVPTRQALSEVIEKIARILPHARLGSYYATLSPTKKSACIEELKTHKMDIVVARLGGLFLPFAKLGLIIVSQAESASYKQVGHRPYYHGRHSALIRAKYQKIPTILGDVLPSVESYYNQKIGKYTPINLKWEKAPHIQIIHPLKSKKRSGFTLVVPQILEKIKAQLHNKERVIILQRRRGYALYHICHACQSVVQCPRCQVSLTYHEKESQLVCHYCNHTEGLVSACKACGAEEMRQYGVGIQQIEEHLRFHLPTYTIARVDRDNTKSSQKVWKTFQEGAVDLLIGTPHLIKDLATATKAFVVILDFGDWIPPTFRGQEEVLCDWARMSQGKHEIIVQTNHPPLRRLVRYLREGGLSSFYQEALAERKNYAYPPFVSLIALSWQGKSDADVQAQGDKLRAFLAPYGKILGPFPKLGLPPKTFGQSLWLTLSKEKGSRTKIALRKALRAWQAQEKSLSWDWEIDPT